MAILFALLIGVLTATGIFLSLRAQTFPVVLGLTLLSYAVNLFLFGTGRLASNAAAVLGSQTTYTDPLPQALVLTAIVIAFAMTAFVIVLALKTRAALGSDHVDGDVDPAVADTPPATKKS